MKMAANRLRIGRKGLNAGIVVRVFGVIVRIGIAKARLRLRVYRKAIELPAWVLGFLLNEAIDVVVRSFAIEFPRTPGSGQCDEP